jgi:hypothetical protein
MVRVSLCIFTRTENFVCCQLDTLRVNGDAILPPLNACADRVSYSPVLHQIKLTLNWKTHKAGRRAAAKLLTRKEARRIAANIAKLVA